MKRPSSRLSATFFGFLVILAMAQPAQASFTTSLDLIRTGATPSGPAPWLRATFEDSSDVGSLSAGTVRLTLTSLLSSSDFVKGSKNNLGWVFNLNPKLAAEDLSFSGSSGSLAHTVVQATDNTKLPPFDPFDFGFLWKPQNRFEAGEIAVYLITISGGGLVASDFAYLNGDGAYSAAHIQGIGTNDDSSKIYSDDSNPGILSIAPVPPGCIMLASAAPFLLVGGYFGRRRPSA